MDKKERANILSLFLKAALSVNVLVIIIGLTMLFVTNDTYGVYASSICAISALINCIGLILILRWHFSGVFPIVIASIVSTVSISITCAGWLQYTFGTIGLVIPYLVLGIYIVLLFTLLFFKVKGKTAWQQMEAGFDYKHFRHIYQLSTVIIAAIAITAYLVMPNQPEVNIDSEDEISHLIENVSPERLDAADVTIEEVVSFEKQYNDANNVNNRDKNVTKRIFALKHLLLSGLMPEIHNRENLVNICMVHAGEFSPEQQAIIDWYLALEISIQEEWNICNKAISISDFKSKIEERIK